MKRVICLFLCLLMLAGSVPAAPVRLLADEGGAGESAGNGENSDTGDSSGNGENGDTGDSSGNGEEEPEDEIVPLTPPSKVGWGRDYHFLLNLYKQQNSEKILTDELETEYVACPGMIYWSLDSENQKQYQINLYRQDEEAGPVLLESVESWAVTGDRTMDSNFRFLWDNRASGDYYFTIRAVGDGIHYSESEVVQSTTWTYEAPEEQLTRPARPRWKGTTKAAATFIYPPTEAEDEANGNIDSTYRVGYEARWWYAASLTKDEEEEETDSGNSSGSGGDSGNSDTGNSDSGNSDTGNSDTGDSGGAQASVSAGEDDDTGNSDTGNSDTGDSGNSDTGNSDSGNTQKEDPTVPKEAGNILTFYPKHFEFMPSEKMLSDFGSGYYSVQIRALSGDVTKARPSEWSELSMARYIASESDDLATIVDRVDEKSDQLNLQLAINNVRKFGTYKLVELMSADQNNTGAVASIVELEDITGNYAQIVVSGGMSELFPEERIQVVGAGLNVDLGQTVVFHLGAAHADEVPSSLYSHAVRFSMQLLDTNGASLTPSGTKLQVPAKITLPVPETMNPSFLVILHHRMDGTVETIPSLSVRKVGKQWYASFVVTDFSDFTMAEQNAFLKASRYSDGVSVSYRFLSGDVKTAFCVVREASGRPCAVAALEPSQTSTTAQIPCAGAASVKLFLLDKNRVPVSAALEASVT